MGIIDAVRVLFATKLKHREHFLTSTEAALCTVSAKTCHRLAETLAEHADLLSSLPPALRSSIKKDLAAAAKPAK